MRRHGCAARSADDPVVLVAHWVLDDDDGARSALAMGLSVGPVEVEWGVARWRRDRPRRPRRETVRHADGRVSRRARLGPVSLLLAPECTAIAEVSLSTLAVRVHLHLDPPRRRRSR